MAHLMRMPESSSLGSQHLRCEATFNFWVMFHSPVVVGCVCISWPQSYADYSTLVQIPAHLESGDNLPSTSFYNFPEALRRFYNCARTWCSQAGILDKGALNIVSDKTKHVKKLTVLLNRLLGMNLQQQQIIFGCEN
jgi:hypothetical protein